MSLLDKATIITTPTAHSDGVLHSIKGGSVADFDVVRGSAATRVNAEGLIEDISIIGGEFVNNGSFDADTNWNKGTGWSIGNNVASCDGTNSNLTQYGVTTIGLNYKVIVSVSNITNGDLSVRLGDTSTYEIGNISSNGVYVFYSESANAAFQFRSQNNFIGSIDNISVKEVIDATNIPRLDYTTGEGVILTEPQSTNLIVNSELNNVENIVVSAVSHTISFYGTGSITLSGTHSATLVGTGASDRVSLTFTPIAGTLICTDSGSVDKKQVEALSYSTSYIPTSGAIATRLADAVTGAGDLSTFNDSEGVLYLEFAALDNSVTLQRFSLSDGTSLNRIYIQNSATNNQIFVSVVSNGVSSEMSTTAYDITQFNKIAIKYKLNDVSLFVNGSKAGTDTSVDTPIGLNKLAYDDGNGGLKFFGKTKTIAVFSEALTDEELTCLTTI